MLLSLFDQWFTIWASLAYIIVGCVVMYWLAIVSDTPTWIFRSCVLVCWVVFLPHMLVLLLVVISDWLFTKLVQLVNYIHKRIYEN